MLRQIKELYGDAIRARDGEIGKIDEILFDDEQWAVRYVVVKTGSWLNGRKVLIAAAALGAVDWNHQVLDVNLTRDQVESSPGIDTDAPVSRQMETEYSDHYGWPYYWGGMGLVNQTGLASVPWNPGAMYGVMAASDGFNQEAEMERDRERNPNDHDDVHLRSSREITGYAIMAEDGKIGHVDDFIIDDKTWRIRYLAVDTRDWWPGKKVLLPTQWIIDMLWPDGTVMMGVSRDQVRNGPEWHPHEPISPTFEAELSDYYARQRAGTPLVTPGGLGLGKG